MFRNHGSSVSFTRNALDIKNNFVQHLRIFDEYTSGRFHRTLEKVIRQWDVLYKVYEPVGYFRKLGYLVGNLGFYGRNFMMLGGPKLILRYLVPNKIIQKAKR